MKNDTNDTFKNKKSIKIRTTRKKTRPYRKSLSPGVIEKTLKVKTKKTAHHIKSSDNTLNKEIAARYRSMVEKIDNGYFEVDLAGNFTFFNDEVCRALGYSRKELMGQNYRQHTDKKTAKIVFQTYNKIYRTGKPVKAFGYNIIRKDGSKRYIEGSVSLRRDSSGKPIGFLGITNDFTRRKHLENTLKKSEALYRLLADHMRDQVALLDLDLRWKYISPSVEKLLGYSLKELKKIPLDRILTGSSFRKAMNIYSMEMARVKLAPPPPSLRHIVELECRCKDGHTVWIEGTFSFIQDKNGKPVSILGEGRDITERKLAEEALRQNEEKYRTILENMQEGYFEVDLAGNFTFFNDSLCRIDGFSKEELMGMNYRQLMDKETAKIIFKAFNTVYTTGNLLPEINYQIIRKDGVKRYTEASVSLLKDSSGKPTGFKGIIRDITDRKNAEEALRESENRYRELSMIDDLTQLYNSRHFYVQLKKETERSNRYEQPLTLMLLDIDKFKDFNDIYGHLEGDLVLSKLGQLVKGCLRETDTAYRYGGEEFTIILPMTTGEEGIITAKRIQAELKKEVFSPLPGHKVCMTMSIGLTQYMPNENIKMFIHRADQLMYKGKKNGRDKICCDDGRVL